MANRAERRAAKKKQHKKPSYHNLTKEQKLEKLFANGISYEDLKKAYEDGRQSAFREKATPLFQMFYAGLCLALNDIHGFGPKRCMDVLVRTDWHITNTFSSIEISQEVLEKLGIEIDMYSPEGHVTLHPNSHGAKSGH